MAMHSSSSGSGATRDNVALITGVTGQVRNCRMNIITAREECVIQCSAINR